MTLLLVLASAYAGLTGAASLFAAVRTLRRREPQSLGSVHPHLVRVAVLNAVCLACATVALAVGTLRLPLAVAAVALSVVGFGYAAWIARHDDSDPGPPLSAEQVERVERAMRMNRMLLPTTLVSLAVIVPTAWVELGRRWALALLVVSALGLPAMAYVPRLLRKSLERRGVAR